MNSLMKKAKIEQIELEQEFLQIIKLYKINCLN